MSKIFKLQIKLLHFYFSHLDTTKKKKKLHNRLSRNRKSKFIDVLKLNGTWHIVILLLLSIIMRIIFIFHIDQPFRVFRIYHFFFLRRICKNLKKISGGVTTLKPPPLVVPLHNGMRDTKKSVHSNVQLDGHVKRHSRSSRHKSYTSV
jgi:hypothetical protein